MHKQLFKQSHGRETSRVRRMQHAAEDEVMALLWDEDLEAVIRMAKRAQARIELEEANSENDDLPAELPGGRGPGRAGRRQHQRDLPGRTAGRDTEEEDDDEEYTEDDGGIRSLIRGFPR